MTQAYQFGALLPSEREGVVRLKPLSERSAVHKDHTVLHQDLGSHQLIVRGIVDHINDPSLASATCNGQYIINRSQKKNPHNIISRTTETSFLRVGTEYPSKEFSSKI